jgi:PHP family Zn ribbon phosphoesterase
VLIITGLAPTVTTNNNATAEPGTGELILTGYAPTVQGSVTIQPGGGGGRIIFSNDTDDKKKKKKNVDEMAMIEIFKSFVYAATD